jgi:hypothetical protein
MDGFMPFRFPLASFLFQIALPEWVTSKEHTRVIFAER